MQFVLFQGLFYVFVAVWLDCEQIRKEQHHLLAIAWSVVQVVYAKNKTKKLFRDEVLYQKPGLLFTNLYKLIFSYMKKYNTYI